MGSARGDEQPHHSSSQPRRRRLAPMFASEAPSNSGTGQVEGEAKPMGTASEVPCTDMGMDASRTLSLSETTL